MSWFLYLTLNSFYVTPMYVSGLFLSFRVTEASYVVEIISLNRLTDSTEINEHRSIREKRQPSFTYISIPV